MILFTVMSFSPLQSVAVVYVAERLDCFLGKNWKSFAAQNYFDSHGLFLSVLWFGPLVITIIILINTLFSLCYMIVSWKRAELRHRARLAHAHNAHHGFGWVREWANTGFLSAKQTIGNGGIRSPMESPIHSSTQKAYSSATLTIEDHQILRDVSKRKLTPGISKSQEFDTAKTRLTKSHRLSKRRSTHSPTSESNNNVFFIRRPSSTPVINFGIDRIKALDMIDRVDSI